MQLNPARGRKPTNAIPGKLNAILRFMQLNPARGRKHYLRRVDEAKVLRFMQLNPARGRKHDIIELIKHLLRVYAAQPREGTETPSR